MKVTTYSKNNWFAIGILVVILIIEWMVFLFGEQLYYTFHHAVETNAVVTRVEKHDEDFSVKDMYITYTYQNNVYEDRYFDTYTISPKMPSEGMTVTVRIDSRSPEHVVMSYDDLLETFPQNTLVLVIVLVVLLFLFMNTNFKTVKGEGTVDRPWIVRFIARRELWRMVLTTAAMLYGGIFEKNGLAYAVWTLGGFFLLRSVTILIKLIFSDKQLLVTCAPCIYAKSDEIGNDTDSTTLMNTIKTTTETLTFYGYGAAAYLCGVLKKDDPVLVARCNGHRTPYLVFKLSENIAYDINNENPPSRKPMSRIAKLAIAVALIAVWLSMPYMEWFSSECNHTYYTFEVDEPSTTQEGIVYQSCSHCFEKRTDTLPMLVDYVEVRMVDKTVTYRELTYLDIDGEKISVSGHQIDKCSYEIEIANQSDILLENLTIEVKVSDREGDELDTFTVELGTRSLQPRETYHHTEERIYVWEIMDIQEQFAIQQIASTPVEELQTVYSVEYDIVKAERS